MQQKIRINISVMIYTNHEILDWAIPFNSDTPPQKTIISSEWSKFMPF